MMPQKAIAAVLATLLIAPVATSQPTPQEVEDAFGIPGVTVIPSTPEYDAKLYAMCADLCALVVEPAAIVPGGPIIGDGLAFLKLIKPFVLFCLIPDGDTDASVVTGNVISGYSLLLGFTQQHWCSFGGSSGGPGSTTVDDGDHLAALSTLFHECLHVYLQGNCAEISNSPGIPPLPPSSGGDPTGHRDDVADFWSVREEVKVSYWEADFWFRFAGHPLFWLHALTEIENRVRQVESRKVALEQWVTQVASTWGPGSIQFILAVLWLQETCDELEHMKEMHTAALAACP